MKKPQRLTTAFEVYQVTGTLGEGANGIVYSALSGDEIRVAIKVLKPAGRTATALRRFRNEVMFCSRSPHPNIIAILDHGLYIDGDNQCPFYVMPSYDGSLKSALSATPIGEPRLRLYGKVLDGVEAAHLRGTWHRDLKPENILWRRSDDDVVIADFGIAHFSQEELYTAVETRPTERLANFLYAAPEQRQRGETVDARADIFALGLILNEIFTGQVPSGVGFQRVADVDANFMWVDGVVEGMLHQDPKRRTATVADVKRALIGHKLRFVAEQTLNHTKQTVVQKYSVDSDYVDDPPALISCDYVGGRLVMKLSRPVNTRWAEILRDGKFLRSYYSVSGSGPSDATVAVNEISVRAKPDDAHKILEYFKLYVELANQSYLARLRNDAAKREQTERERLEAQIREEEQRQEVLSRLKL